MKVISTINNHFKNKSFILKKNSQMIPVRKININKLRKLLN